MIFKGEVLGICSFLEVDRCFETTGVDYHGENFPYQVHSSHALGYFPQ